MVKWSKTPPFHGGYRGSNPLRVTIFWAISSAGRAPALQAGCRRFDPVIAHQTQYLLPLVIFELTCTISSDKITLVLKMVAVVKWLTRRIVVPLFRGFDPHQPPQTYFLGASPSGKALDFDSSIRRFESSRPCHLTIH